MCAHFSTAANSAGVSARIIHNSQNAQAAVDVAVRKKSRFAQALRFLHQNRKLITASVRQAAALMDQMIVIVRNRGRLESEGFYGKVPPKAITSDALANN